MNLLPWQQLTDRTRTQQQEVYNWDRQATPKKQHLKKQHLKKQHLNKQHVKKQYLKKQQHS